MNFWCKKGHFNLDQAKFMKELVTMHQPEYALETGFCTGRSAFTVLSNSKALKKMISIDRNFDYVKPEGRVYQNLLREQFLNFSTIEKPSSSVFND